MRLASDDRVLKTIEYAKSLYLAADDANQRAISGEILYSTARLSNDRFMAFAASALPFVFVFKHDLDKHVREVFEKTWQENVGGNRAVTLYVKEITTLVSENLESPRWAIKHTAALGIANAVTSLDPDLDVVTSERVWPVLEKALAGKTWEGKEVVLKAFVKFSGQAKRLWQEKKPLSDSMRVSELPLFIKLFWLGVVMLTALLRPLRSGKLSETMPPIGHMVLLPWAGSHRHAMTLISCPMPSALCLEY